LGQKYNIGVVTPSSGRGAIALGPGRDTVCFGRVVVGRDSAFPDFGRSFVWVVPISERRPSGRFDAMASCRSNGPPVGLPAADRSAGVGARPISVPSRYFALMPQYRLDGRRWPARRIRAGRFVTTVGLRSVFADARLETAF
jgi:hypothetical protein